VGRLGADPDPLVGLDLRRAWQHRLERPIVLGVDDAVEDERERTGRGRSSQVVGEGPSSPLVRSWRSRGRKGAAGPT
jgi:hypothetical protein